VGWLIAALIMAITIIGLPWARAAFNIAWYTAAAVRPEVVRRDEYTGYGDLGTGPLGTLGKSDLADPRRLVAGARHLITAVVLALTIIACPLLGACELADSRSGRSARSSHRRPRRSGSR